jgi:Flp pilus assembly protein TadD
MRRQKNSVTRAFVLATVIGLTAAVPAQAGWFGGSEATAPSIDDRAIAQIQQALDDARYVDAGTLLDRALMSEKNDPRLVLLVGDLNLARGRYDLALESFKRVDARPELHARAQEGEGVALSLLGRVDEALPILETAAAANSASWHVWNALGVIYDRKSEWSKASTAYGHAISASGSSPIVLNNRGFSRLSQNKLDDAAADFVLALQKKPDFASARNNLRLTIAMKGDYARATEGAGGTDRASILNNAGFAAMARGDYTTAEKLLGQAMEAKGEYYAVAAANLERVRGLQSGGSSNGTISDAGVH